MNLGRFDKREVGGICLFSSSNTEYADRLTFPPTSVVLLKRRGGPFNLMPRHSRYHHPYFYPLAGEHSRTFRTGTRRAAHSQYLAKLTSEPRDGSVPRAPFYEFQIIITTSILLSALMRKHARLTVGVPRSGLASLVRR